MSVCLSVCISVCLCMCLSVCLSHLSVCLSVCLYVCLSVSLCLSVRVCLSVSVYLSVCLSDCLSVCLYVCLSLSLCLSVPVYLCLSVCLSVCLCLMTLAFSFFRQPISDHSAHIRTFNTSIQSKHTRYSRVHPSAVRRSVQLIYKTHSKLTLLLICININICHYNGAMPFINCVALESN